MQGMLQARLDQPSIIVSSITASYLAFHWFRNARRRLPYLAGDGAVVGITIHR